MMLRAYSLYDLKAQAFSPPFFMATDGLAVRALQELTQDMNTTVGRHPSDYRLFFVGNFNDQSGIISAEHHVHVVDAVVLVTKVPAPLFDEAAQ